MLAIEDDDTRGVLLYHDGRRIPGSRDHYVGLTATPQPQPTVHFRVSGGGSTTYTAVLHTQPTGNVTVTPTSSNPAVATVSGPLTFTPSNWNQPQGITVTGHKERNRRGFGYARVTITHAVAGADYDNLGRYEYRPNPVKVEVQTVPARIVSMAFHTPGADCWCTAGEDVELTVTYSEPVTVNTTSGTPRMAIYFGVLLGERRCPTDNPDCTASEKIFVETEDYRRWADYRSGTGTTQLLFSYRMAAGDGSYNRMSIDHNNRGRGL